MNKNSQNEISDELKFFTDRLMFLWEQYNKIIQMTLLLAGATIATILSIVLKLSDVLSDKGGIEWLGLSISAVFIAVLSGLFALGWRFSAQTIMERQIYGDRDNAIRFFESTQTMLPWALDEGRIKFMVFWFDISKYASGPLLIISWILIVIFTLKNVVI